MLDLGRLKSVLPPSIIISGPLRGGGQGTVFRGMCNGQSAAIKIFRPDTDTRRVDREIELLSKVTSPNVVHLLGHCETIIDAEAFRILAYELHDGGDLAQYAAPAAPNLSFPEIARIGSQVGNAIETLWSKRIVHRDIKPANIVRASDGRSVLVDVGFARYLDRSDITIAGSPGTRGFRSPEQARGRRALTIHSDVFSLGVTLFVLATKRHPFGGRDLVLPETIDKAALLARRDIPEPFANLIHQMTDFTPAKRPSDLVARFASLGGQ
jgi:eukaryotic-like serine/threonine-protein kinase